MALAAGDRLGHYEILAPLGAGGMGEVWRARDERLGREVAIKVLPDSLAGDRERLARFEREAKTLASVNHANVAVLYGIENAPETDSVFLAMELVEGDDLAQRIRRGPLAIEDTITLAAQIATGLEAAHLKGIVHRDLKPANIRITPDGTVKILDFGLAKETGPAPGDASFTESPTVTADMTLAGTILGTAPYLSPEQARGQAVDRRTDIWAFGCILYEMLTGHRAFPGETATEILARVLERDPDWGDLPADIPTGLERLLRRCLERRLEKRIRDAGDVALDLEDLELEGPAAAASEGAPARGKWNRAIPWLVAAAAVLLAIGGWIVRAPPEPGQPPAPLRFSERPSAALDIARVGHMGSAVAISPDGTVLVWVGFDGATTRLYSRQLDEQEALPIDGTEGALAPFFSPDGEWIGFVADQKLKKIAVGGGVPLTICEAEHIHGASWGDHVILMESGGAGSLARVDPSSSKAEVFRLEGNIGFLPAFPNLLPGSEIALISGLDESHIGLLSLDTGEATLLPAEGSNATYVPTGHLVWASGNSLLAAPFDLERRAITGDAHTVIEGVLVESGYAAHYSVSHEGTLVYLPGTATHGALQPSWLRMDGTTEELPIPAEHSILSPRISPDGSKVLLSCMAEHQNIIIIDLERGTAIPLAEGEGNQYWAVWTPDGKAVVFNWLLGSDLDLWIRPVDLSRPPRRLTTTPGQLNVPMEITRDGRTVFLGATSGLDEVVDLHVLDLDGDGTTRQFLVTGGHTTQAKLSPDGRLLAYSSDHTGRLEVYLQPYPGPGATARVSPNGGQEPLWSPAGDRIYYRSIDGGRIFAVDVLDRDLLRLGREVLLLEGEFAPGIRWGRKWDIHPDGDRFLVLRVDNSQSPREIRVVRNWFTELVELEPGGR